MNSTEAGPVGPVTEAAGQNIGVMESLIAFVTAGVDRLAEVQKLGLDLAAKQNAQWVEMSKKLVPGSVAAQSLPLLEVTSTAFDRCLEMQKNGIDLMVQQTHTLADLAKERVGTAAKAANEPVPLVKEAFKQAVDGGGLLRQTDQSRI